MQYFISIDIGTNFIKATTFSSKLHTLSPLVTHTITQKDNQLIPHTVEQALILCIKEILATLALKDKDTINICISGNSPTLVFLNKNKEPIYCTPWHSPHYTVLHNEHSYYLPFVVYVHKNKPTLFKNVAHVMPLAEYASFLLCDTLATFIPHNNYIHYLWSKESIDTHALPHNIFPSFRISGSVLGNAQNNLAVSLGLTRNNTTILCGSIDYLSALIGSSTVHAGNICIRGGTSTVMNICLDQTNATTIEKEPDHSLFPEFTLPHPIESKINKGISIPYFNMLYNDSNIAFEYLYKNPSIIPLLWKFFYQNHHACTIHTRENNTSHSYISQKIHTITQYLSPYLTSSFENTNIHEQYSIIALICMLTLIKKIYNQLKYSIDTQLLTNIAVSGQQFTQDIFNTLIATLLQKKINVYDYAYCELRGNILFALSQNQGANLQTDKIHTQQLEYYATKYSHPTKSYIPKNHSTIHDSST